MFGKTTRIAVLTLCLLFSVLGKSSVLAADVPKVIYLYPPGSPTLKGAEET